MSDLKRLSIADTGIEISEIGLGTVKFGRNTGVKYPRQFTLPTRDELSQLLNLARQLGINYLDTAPAYGTSEKVLGELLPEFKDDFVISTKVGEYFADGVSRYDFSSDATKSSIEHSLEALGLTELDMVYVHSDGRDQFVIENTEVLKALGDLKQQGVIRAIGFSGKVANESALALELCDVFMVTLNEGDLSQAELIASCHAAGKAVVIKKALNSGHSTDPGVALRFVNQFPGVTSTIIGTINPEHLKSNVGAITGV